MKIILLQPYKSPEQNGVGGLRVEFDKNVECLMYIKYKFGMC